ncbi:recombinase family protein [Clostridium sp. MB40-C1]|uniref:recombinase family protein n=1 Tax=Clostridium sp. MB40-C1 TaxID=3070996 RepID=UPI0027DFEDC7|nr:recombinase family protein [Clostridium sp. MB40-C1]WMJ79779.1 recombinase family protein [Clostridium sp. MB40-C1]
MNGLREIWNVAIYARVSTDKKDQQESIPVQVQSLKKWILEKSKNDKGSVYNLIEIYKDQGFSGSNFQRDSFIRMKEDIEKGKVNMILTRDLSRFARNYVVAGYYIEDYFKVNNVRFISVLDNVDTLEEVNDIVPFKNILNEMYIKDCSRRTRDGLKQRMIRGSSIASKPPYGYKIVDDFEGNIKTKKLVPSNDETTEVVKLIYDLYLQGWGFGRIATYLNKKNILPPSAKLNNFPKAKFGRWSNNTIQSILMNPKYGGIMVQGQYKRVSYKLKKIVKVSKEEWIYGGEFKGIISKDKFYEVQKEIKRRSKGYRYKGNAKHIFSTVLKCNECDGSMSYNKKYKGYKCSNSQRGGGRCTSHSIKEDYLKGILIEDLKKIVQHEVNKDELYEEAKNIVSKKNSCKKEFKQIETELKKLDIQFENIYVDRVNGVINDRNFENITKGIQQKQNSLLRRKEELLKLEQRQDNKDNLYKIYKNKIDKILSLQEVDRYMVESLIDKIIVHEDKMTRKKSIEICYKFHR